MIKEACCLKVHPAGLFFDFRIMNKINVEIRSDYLSLLYQVSDFIHNAYEHANTFTPIYVFVVCDNFTGTNSKNKD